MADALDALIANAPPAASPSRTSSRDPLDDIINSAPSAATGMGTPSPISATERWKYLGPPTAAPAPELQARFLQLADKNPTVPGMEKIGGVAPPVPALPVPPEPIETSLQSKPLFTPEETGFATPALNTMGQGLGNAMAGVEAMTRPTLKEKAAGAHQAFGGAMGLATPLMAGAAGRMPLRTAATVGAFAGAQKGTDAGLQALGLAPEYSAVIGDLMGLMAGAAPHRLAAPEMAQLKSTLMHRMADKVASEPQQEFTMTGEPVRAPEPPSKTKTVSPATPNPPSAALRTVPESPETQEVQIQQLQQGIRKVVMFPKDTYPPVDAPTGNIAVTHDKFGNVYWYRTDLIEPGVIHRAAENNELPQILGGPEGLGAPDKSQSMNGPVVVARGPTGTEVQSTATTPEQLPQTIAAHGQVTPPGGSVEVTTPEDVIADRQPGPVSQFIASEEGAFKPQDFLKEPIELHGLRGLMQRALAVRNPVEQQAKLGKYSRQYYVGNRDWWITKVNQQLDTIANLPEVEQRAVSIMREFRRRRGELVQMLANSHPTYKNIDAIKPEIRLAMNPTPEMVRADDLLTHLAAVHLAEAQRLGIFKKSSILPDEYVPHDIIPHYYAKDVDLMSPATGGNMNPNFSHAKARKAWETFVDAVNEGALPRTMNARDAFTVYSKEFATTRATAMWEDWIKGLGFGEWDTAKPERIGPTSAATDLTPFARQSNRFIHQVAVPGPTSTSPPRVVGMKFWVPKFIDKAMEPVTAKDFTQDWPIFKSFQEYQQFVKGVELALSFFHPKALFMMLVSDMRKPSDATTWANLDMNSPKAREWEADGALFGTRTDVVSRNLDALGRMEPDKMPSWPEIVKSTPGIKQLNQFAEYNTRLIFGVMQRKLKVWTYGTMRDRWLTQHPKATPEQVVEAKTSIARFVDAKFGGLNFELMGWNKGALSVARFFMLAPDWFMSNIESASMGFSKGAGGAAARRFWVQGMLMAGAATQLMSVALTGHPSKHFTEVDEGDGKYRNWFFTGAPGELVNVVNAIARQGFGGGLEKWSLGKGNVLIRTGLQGAFNETYAGKKINAPDLNPIAKTVRTAAYSARSAAPVPFSIQNIVDTWTKGMGGKELTKEAMGLIFGGRPAYKAKEEKEFPRDTAPLLDQIMTGKATVSDKAPASADRTKVLKDIRSGTATPEEIKDAEDRKLITGKDERTAGKSGKLTPLQRQVKGASAQAAVRIYDQAQPAQRKEIEKIVRDKVKRARTHGADWTDQGAALAKKHFGVDVERLSAPAPIR